VYTERWKHGENDQSLNLLQCSLRSHLAEIINGDGECNTIAAGLGR